MTLRIWGHLGIAALLALAACNDSGGGDDGPSGDTDTDTDTDSDTDADTDTDTDTDTDSDSDEGAPWYLCPDEEFPDDATVVTAFDQEYQYITFGDTGVNNREVESVVTFPDAGGWSQIMLWFELECPESGLCDHWDRVGSVQLVEDPGGDNEEFVELARFVTPYRIEMCQYIDVTHLAPRLAGEKTLRSFIDTWVGPGHDSGEGWRTTVKFVFIPDGDNGPAEIINIWGRRNITVGEIETDVNVDSQIDPVTVEIPADASNVTAQLFSTGHSFGNTLNCAEFCQMRKDIIVNGEIHSVNNWRDDCESNPVSPQYGTWEYDRNGWCPGAIVVGDLVDITDDVVIGGENTIDFDIRLADGTEYDNMSPVDLLPYEIISLKLLIYN